MSYCPDGKFGHDCQYDCNCFNRSEICDDRTGHCTSGCLPAFYGPGCTAEYPDGDDDTDVIVLAIFFSLTLLLLILLIIYTFVYRPRKQRDKQEYAARAEEQAYDFAEMAKQSTSTASSDPAAELRGTVPRIKETDISVVADPIGKGRYGDVMKGHLTVNNNKVVVAYKTLEPGTPDDDKTAFLSQLEMYSVVDPHDNVLRFYGVCAVGDQVFAAFEYAEHGNLRNFLRKRGVDGDTSLLDDFGPVTRGKLLTFAHDAAAGMRHLAKQNIVHRSLSARHILVCGQFSAKIAGLNSPNGSVRAATKRWLAPESLAKGEFTTQSDIWSFGVLMWEIMSFGGQPYVDYSTDNVKDALASGYRLPKPDGCESDIYGLMRWCWKEKPDDRPTFLILSNTMREMIESGQVRLDLTDDSDLDDSS